MPRPSRSTHPLAKIRKILGISQAQLGEATGVSQSYVNAVESGTREPSKGFRIALQARYGICSHHLVPGNKYVPKLKEGHFQSTKAVSKIYNDRARSDSRDLILKFEALVEAAQSEQKAVVLLLTFTAWMDQMIDQMGLEQSYWRALMKRLDTPSAVCFDHPYASEEEADRHGHHHFGFNKDEAPKKPRRPSASRARGNTA